MLVRDDALYRRAKTPQVPELDEAVLAARHHAEGLVGVVVYISRGVAMRILERVRRPEVNVNRCRTPCRDRPMMTRVHDVDKPH